MEPNVNEKWIPIVDYAVLKGISTSTLRRYIKAKKLPFKIENGRYLIPANSNPQIDERTRPALRNWDGVGDINTESRLSQLERNLAQAQEQIDELKMLVAIYEEKIGKI